MRRWLATLAVCAFFTLGAEQIQWITNYQEAEKEAEEKKLPILLYFTGSDWCGWCKKLEGEVLETHEFASLAKGKFVFVKLDFPNHSNQAEKETKQNKELQQQYKVRGFPTVILLSSDQKQIGMTGYRPGGGREYANHLLKMVQDYSGYKEQISTLGQSPRSGKDLMELHEKAKEFDDKEDAEKIAMAGIHTDEAPYFLLERLRQLTLKGEGDLQEAIDLKKKLLASNPNNRKINYQLAILDFETRYHNLQQGKGSLNATLAPLTSYLDQYGVKDQENNWRIQMIVSQVYRDQKDFSEALRYAQLAYKNAPDEAKSDIGKAIEEITNQQKSE